MMGDVVEIPFESIIVLVISSRIDNVFNVFPRGITNMKVVIV